MFSPQWQTKTPIRAIAFNPLSEAYLLPPSKWLQGCLWIVHFPSCVRDDHDLTVIPCATLNLSRHLTVVEFWDDEAFDVL